MSTEIQQWEDRAPAERAPVAHLVTAPGPPPPANDIDSWVEIASAYTRLASQIANTDFPPAEMRGKPEALVATFLMGREMHLGPMTALMNLHVIKGKVGQSAHLMRAMILAAGHEFDIIEASDSRVVARGRRRGEHSYTDVAFTADQARRAKIDLGNYPEDKLVARATARLARRKFADVISGMAYSTEELADGDVDEPGQLAAVEPSAQATAEEAPKATRTARRPASTSTAKRATATPARAATPQSAPSAATAPSGPPLPGEEEPEQAAAPTVEEKPAAPQTAMITKTQSGKLHALFNEGKVTDRDARLRVVSSLADRPVASSNELTKDEASDLIDQLQDLGADGVAALADTANTAGSDEPVQAELVEDGGDS